ncbi:MAG: hypothetical protein EOO74_00455 [Myxococcales bacterium]|nr:MAG: hypothetical protein EOO74_00455 [Myxococcales bacterium]
MLTDDALTTFRQRLADRGQTLEALTPRAGLAAMVDFYRDERAEDCDLEDDGDMMLVQWGKRKGAKGKPATFYLDVTRQFTGTEEDADMWHLSLTFVFPLEGTLQDIKDDDQWVMTPAELAEEPGLLTSLPGVRAVGDRTDGQVSLEFDLQ